MDDTLEADWNDALRQFQAAQDDYDRATAAAQAMVPRNAKLRSVLSNRFPTLWSDPATPQRERKRMVRLLIEDVTVVKTDEIHLHVRFRGGQTTSLSTRIPPNGWKARRTNPDTVALLDQLLDDYTDDGVAEQLNHAGHRSGNGMPFTGQIVLGLRFDNKTASHADRLRARGLLTIDCSSGRSNGVRRHA